MSTPFKFFVSCLFCFALSLLNGCGGGGSFTPAEQAEVDKYIAEYGRDAMIYYLAGKGTEDTDEIVFKYVKYFVSRGANVNAKDSVDMTPLHWTCFRKKVVEFLVSKEADVNAKSPR
jgi:ankyrin repeat protein